MSPVLKGQEMREKKQGTKCKGKKTSEKKEKLYFLHFTFCHTLCSVGDVIQGDVGPHISPRLCLEGHSERCWVGQDDISVCPLVTMVSSGCPHQQTGATRSNRVDLV